MRLSLRYRLLLPLTLLLLGDVAATAWAAEAAARDAERRLTEQLWRIARTLTEPRTPTAPAAARDRQAQPRRGLPRSCCSVGQAAANPGCSGRRSTSSTVTHDRPALSIERGRTGSNDGARVTIVV